MTVKETIEKLRLMPQDAMVINDHGEVGYLEAEEVKVMKIALNVTNDSTTGDHRRVTGHLVRDHHERVEAVYIG